MRKTAVAGILFSCLASVSSVEGAGNSPVTMDGVEKTQPAGETDGLDNILPLFMRSDALGKVMTQFISDLSFIQEEDRLLPVLQSLTDGINQIIEQHRDEINDNNLENLEKTVLAKKGDFIQLIEEAAKQSNPGILELMRFKRGLNEMLGSDDYREFDGPSFDKAFSSSDYFRKMMKSLFDAFQQSKDEKYFSALFKNVMETISKRLEDNEASISEKDLSALESQLKENLPLIQQRFQGYGVQLKKPDDL